jgi:dTDP-4-dehydrorhamnose 3,5-epimerase
MPFSFKRLEIPDVILVEPKVFGDDRGFFVETYKQSEFLEAGIKDDFIQDNHSKSCKGVLRGLHYQLPPCAQSKLIRCLQGAIWDVAVDIRKDSPTYGQWVAEELTQENKRMLYIPQGFAHGFLTLSETAEIAYKVNAEYAPDCDRGIRWNCPELNIDWPFNDGILLSGKDENAPSLKDAEVFA